MIFQPIQDWYANKFDKFGFYEVGSFKTYSKLEAIEVSRRLNVPFNWNFNDAIFSSYDWTKEPTESLDELYVARAKQIREKYDHVTILFSGGADSTNMLWTFIDNNIKIDEIIILDQIIGDNDPVSWFNCETSLVAKPLIQKIKHLIPDTEITNIDLTIPNLENIRKHRYDILYQTNTIFPANSSSSSLVRRFTSKWFDMEAKGITVGFVYAHQKPMIHVSDTNKFYYYIDDKMNFCVHPSQQVENREDERTELFYSSPDCVPLLIKQAHVVKRFLQNPIIDNTYFEKTKHAASGVIRHNDEFYGLRLTGLNQIIYSAKYWNPDTFTRGKNRSFIWSLSDQYFHNTDEWIIFKKNLDAIASKFGEWYMPPESGVEGIKPSRSKYHLLG